MGAALKNSNEIIFKHRKLRLRVPGKVSSESGSSIWDSADFQEKGEKSLTSKYGLVPESPNILHCEKATFTGYITS